MRSHREQQRAIEDGAAAAAAFVLGARARRIDDGRQHNTRDFDLIFADGHVEPLEVTQHAHQPSRHTQARLDARGMSVDLDLSEWWWVSVPRFHTDARGNEHPLDIEACSRELQALLRLLEELGIRHFNTSLLYTDPRLRRFADRVSGLRISEGRSVERDAAARAPTLTLIPSGGGVVSADAVTAAVEREASDRANQEKLQLVPGAARRHLFVAIDLSAGLTYAAARHAFETGEMPRLPGLPPAITTAWAAVDRATELLVTTPPEPWTARKVPYEVRDHPERWLIE